MELNNEIVVSVYEAPTASFVYLKSQDVISTSGGENDTNGDRWMGEWDNEL